MRSVGLCVLVVAGLTACGSSSGGGGGGGVFYGGDGYSQSDVTPTADSGGGSDVSTLTDTTSGGSDTASGGSDVLAPGSLKTCVAASQCAIDACKDKWSLDCGKACANAAAPDAASPASALLNCTTTKCFSGKCAGNPTQKCMDDCTASDCPNELVACWSQGATPGNGGCSTVADCLTKCDSDPERFTCQSICYNALSTAAVGQFQALTACLGKNGGDYAKCGKETLTCLSDGKSGSSSCYDVQACIGKCAKTDATCQGACYGQGSTTAQTQLMTLLDCITKNGADKCLDPTIACATPSGTAGCMTTANCVTGCPTGDAQGGCIMDCLHKTSTANAASFGKLATCMTSKCPNCGNNCTTCAIMNCGSQANSCK